MPNFAVACIPANETARLAALRQLGLLDSEPGEKFDRITRLAARTLALPIVLVSLLDESRQWFKSRVGFEASETPRDISFCSHAVYAGRPFAVADATLDERFAANPLVTGPPHARAYLGIPLCTRDGHAVGTLCAIDRVPRTFDAVEIAVLADFAKIIEDAIHALEPADAPLPDGGATDPLTGLADRRAFTQRSEEASRHFDKTGARHGLILLDLDNFKQINDQFGQDAGDEVLRAVGRVLRGQLGNPADVAARLGGEEFAMLCFGELDEASLCEIAERIRSQLKKEVIQTGGGTLRFAGTFGVALSHPGDHDWKGVYARADSALYEAKSSGKDRVLFGSGYTGGATGRFRSLRAMLGS